MSCSGISLTTLLSAKQAAINFMRQWFSKKVYLKIRIIENLIVVCSLCHWSTGYRWMAVRIGCYFHRFNAVNVLCQQFTEYRYTYTFFQPFLLSLLLVFRKNIFILFFSAFLMVMASYIPMPILDCLPLPWFCWCALLSIFRLNQPTWFGCTTWGQRLFYGIK